MALALSLRPRGQLLKMLGQRLASHRLRQNLTQRTLAETSGVAYSTLRRIESTGLGQMADYVALLQALGMADNLDRLLPAPEPSPKALFEAHGKPRKRASKPRGGEDAK